MTPLKLIETQAFIDGQWIAGDRAFEVLDPATGAVIAAVGAGIAVPAASIAVAGPSQALSSWFDEFGLQTLPDVVVGFDVSVELAWGVVAGAAAVAIVGAVLALPRRDVGPRA